MSTPQNDAGEKAAVIAESRSLDIIDNILDELNNKLRDEGLPEREDVEDMSVKTTNTEVGGDLTPAQRQYVRKMVTVAMVKQIVKRKLEDKPIPELMKISKKVHAESIAPKMKRLVDQLAEASARDQDIQAQIKAIGLLGGLDEEDMPSPEMLTKISRELIAKKMKYMSLKNVMRAEEELSVSLEDCRDSIIEAICQAY